jgi:hypothetical protein
MRALQRHRPVVVSVLVVIVVAAAALVWHNLPTPTDLYGPFDVRGKAGEAVRGRTLTVTVTSVQIAPQVNSIQAAGEWVVVDTTMDANVTTELPRAELMVGPNTYVPSERFFGDTLGAEVAPGITQRGGWVFDVAAPLVADGASEAITLRVWAGSDLLDSRLVIDVPAGDPHITRADDIELTSPEVSAR